MKQRELELQTTEDGSHTLHSPIFEATYHSTHGAIQEAQVVFIDAALNYQLEQNKSSLNILEIGFGTGLNAFMTYLATAKGNTTIYYEGWEAYPVGQELATSINYTDLLNSTTEDEATFLQMHQGYNQIKNLRTAPGFEFYLKKDFFEAIEAEEKFDAIYQDAFAPGIQAELWEEHFLQKLYNALKSGGILTTYCAKGSFKRALKAVGFEVEALAGPKGKREMTRAHKS